MTTAGVISRSHVLVLYDSIRHDFPLKCKITNINYRTYI